MRSLRDAKLATGWLASVGCNSHSHYSPWVSQEESSKLQPLLGSNGFPRDLLAQFPMQSLGESEMAPYFPCSPVFLTRALVPFQTVLVLIPPTTVEFYAAVLLIHTGAPEGV
jgi:hypothetical protein